MRLSSALLAVAATLATGVVADEFLSPVYDFLSRPDIHAQRITVTHYNPHSVAPGYLFLTPWAPEVQKGVNYDFAPSIYDNNGELVWTGFNSSDRAGGCQVFFMTEYDGEPALAFYHFQKDTWWSPVTTILNDRYEIAATVQVADTQNLTWTLDSEAANGLALNGTEPYGLDMHDMNIVTGPARVEPYPIEGVDFVEQVPVTGRRRSTRTKSKRDNFAPVVKRKTATTAILTMGRIISFEEPFVVCNKTMNWIHSPGFQEIALDGNNTLLFQWDPAEHIPINETVICGGSFDHGDIHSLSIGQHPWHIFDFFHRNSIDKDRNGDYILSARHTSTIYKISGVNGTVLWRLGGPKSDFQQISNVPGVNFDFAFQHHARIANVPGSDPEHGIMGLTFWDNANNIYDYSNAIAPYSAGKTVLVDEVNMIATLTEAYTLPGRLLGVNQGSHQALPNGNHIIGGGNIGMVAEYAPAPMNPEQQVFASENGTANTDKSPSGELVFAAHYGGGPMNSYRAQRFDWHAYPSSAPAIFGYARDCPSDEADHEAYYYVSWNGATEVARWVILGADAPDGPFHQVATARRTGFETTAHGTFAGYTIAVAYDAQDRELGGSEVTRTWVPNEVYVDQGARPASDPRSAARRRRNSMVLDAGSCSNKRCLKGFHYSWARARTCAGMTPPPAELDMVMEGWTNGGWHINSKGSTVSITKTFTAEHPPATAFAMGPLKYHPATTTSETAAAASTVVESTTVFEVPPSIPTGEALPPRRRR